MTSSKKDLLPHVQATLSRLECSLESSLDHQIAELQDLKSILFGGGHSPSYGFDVTRDKSQLGTDKLQCINGSCITDLSARINEMGVLLAKYNAIVELSGSLEKT